MKATNLTRQQSLAISRGLVAPIAARSFSWIEDMTNETGADIVEGSVVVVLADGTIELADTLNDPRPTGVALDIIDDGETGQVCFGGPVDLVLVTASVTAGQYGSTSTTAGEAQVAGSVANAFCVFTSSGTEPEAFLWGGRGGGLGGGTGPGSGTPGWFNVTDYGATGDGVTDDGPAIQDASDAAAAACGTLYFPPGSYLVGAAITIDPNTNVLGAGRECTFILAGANSINVLQITGTAQETYLEVNHAATITGIDVGANGHTGCIGLALIGVAYFDVRRCTFRDFTIGSEYYGSLQGRFDDCKFLSNATGVKYSTQNVTYATLPPSRVLVNWCTFYYNTTYAIDWSGGQQIIVSDTEMGRNGTAANSATGCLKVRMGGDADGFGLIAHNLWLEENHGNAVLDLGGTSVGNHSLTDLWLVYTDATYSISLDGSTAAQTIVARNVRHDDYIPVPTVSTWRSAGGTTYLHAIQCDGSLSGTWTATRQEPLLSGQLVSDLSAWLALRLPNVTTTQRDAIASPTAGMLVWNTSTTAVNEYTGSAWTTVGFANPMTTRGDLIIEDSTPTPVRLPIGVVGTVLTSDGTDPSWQSIPTQSGAHAHVASETHLSNGSTVTWTLDQAFEPGSVIAWNISTPARLGVTETAPDQATVSAAGTSGDSIVFDYAASIA